MLLSRGYKKKSVSFGGSIDGRAICKYFPRWRHFWVYGVATRTIFQQKEKRCM